MSVSVPPSSGSTSRLAFSGAIVAGRYRLEEVVGYGGMGSVWRATHIGLGEQVAVKLVSANFVRSSEALRRFDTEAKAAAKLRSRHVPQVFDNGVLEDGTPFLVMELLHGESLAARVSRLGPIPLPETVSILEQCCRALARAHSLGIVHRDIKPENVYLAQSVDDDGYIVKVLDFGIAKVTSSLNDDGRSSTRTGTLLGTPLYMSPEQARGLRSINFPTDIYSLGLVAYTMLAGKLPFSGETLGELLLQICTEPLPSLRGAAPGLPPAMESWFQKACARQPEHRFASAHAFIEALRVAAGISTPGAPDFVPGRAFPQVSADETAGAARLPEAPSAPGFVVIADALSIPSTTGGASLSTSLPTRRARWVWMAASAVVGLGAIPTIVFLWHGHDQKAAESTPAIHAVSASAAATSVPSEAGTRETLAPLIVDSAGVAGQSPTSARPAISRSPPGSASGIESRAPLQGIATPRATAPGVIAVSPSLPSSSSSSNSNVAPRPTNKPPGAIDLGY